MNIIYHTSIGVAGLLITHDPMFLVGSVIQDVTLLYNEIVNRPFNPTKVDRVSMFMYSVVHSVWVVLLAFLVSPTFGIAYAIHVGTDSFTHTGKFAWKPYYPLSNYHVTYGKEVLK